MWRRGSNCGWRRKLCRPGCRVFSTDCKTLTYANQITGLSATMSRYLIRRIENTPTIILRPQTEIVDVEGGDHLDSVYWRNNQTGQTEKHEIRHIFVMTGADPNTGWLDGCVTLDSKGFIKAGPRSVTRKSERLQVGLFRDNPTCLKPVCPVFSQWATCGW